MTTATTRFALAVKTFRIACNCRFGVEYPNNKYLPHSTTKVLSNAFCGSHLCVYASLNRLHVQFLPIMVANKVGYH
jgi:hypothetical protein